MAAGGSFGGHTLSGSTVAPPMAAAAAAPTDANPPEIHFPYPVFCTAFHPLADVVAVGLVSGRIELYVGERVVHPRCPVPVLGIARLPTPPCRFTYSVESCDRVMTASHHKESCRALSFTPDGTSAWSSAPHARWAQGGNRVPLMCRSPQSCSARPRTSRFGLWTRRAWWLGRCWPRTSA